MAAVANTSNMNDFLKALEEALAPLGPLASGIAGIGLAAGVALAPISNLASGLTQLSEAAGASLTLLSAPITALGVAAEQASVWFGNLGNRLLAPIEMISGAVTSLGKAASNAMMPLNTLVGSIHKLASGALTALGPAMAALQVGMSEEVQKIRALVAKANPMAAFQFDRALDDLAATMGQILTPILQAVTGFIREFADVMQGLRPVLAPIMTGIAQIFGQFSRLLLPIAQMITPALELLGDVMTEIVVPGTKLLVDVLIELGNTIKFVVETISLGLIKLDLEKKSSVGAAIRPASYSKGVEDIGKRTTMAALNQSAKNDVPSKIDTTNGLLGKILEKIGAGKETSDVANKIWKWTPDPINTPIRIFKELRGLFD